MKTLALLSMMLALPLAAQSDGTIAGCQPVPDGICRAVAPGTAVTKEQTPLTPEEDRSYLLMVIQDLGFENTLLENLRNHKAGNEDLENQLKAHQERMNALKQLITKHSACEGGDWNIAKKEWSCPPAPAPAK